jgi:hypothetical protein
MVMANASLHIDESKNDCGTKKTFEILVTDDIINIIQRRFYVEGNKILNISNITDVLNKKIKLRTPLYCIAGDGICPTCYGNLWKIVKSKNIGILAGQAANTVGINSMMKMRHKSSSDAIKEVNFLDMIKKAGLDIADFKKYFEITNTTITAKVPCSIILDQNEYDDTTLIDCGDKYQIPGILQVQIGDAPDFNYINFPFAIAVDLYKSTDFIVDGKIITMNYEIGELIIKQQFYEDTFNERVVDRLFSGNTKYINNPEILVMNIQNNLPGIDLVHIEAIVSNMFRDSENEMIPARLTNYKDFNIIGQKKLPDLSFLTSLAFENMSRAIKTGLIEGREASMNPIELLVLEKYLEI